MLVTPQDLNKLRQIIPFKWRIQSAIPKAAPTHVQLIAYVDARDVCDHFDSILSPENWCDDYYELKGNLFCKIGIKINNEWVFKTDVGTESNVDKKKGESSDAFKRAAVKWGVNREAYRVGIVKLPSKPFNNNHYPVNDKGYFLKGQELYDVCNSIAKIEDMEYYTVDELTLEDLKDLYAEKVLNIPKDQIQNFERIINTQDVKSYAKAYKELQKL